MKMSIKQQEVRFYDKVCRKTVCADDRGTFYSIPSCISADQLYR